MATIKKKTWPDLFEKVAQGEKKIEVRLADFDLKKGDTIILEEWDPETKNYTGRQITKKVSFILKTKDLPYWSDEEIAKHGYYAFQLED